MRVLFLPEVVQQFLELAEILYDKGYLSFKDKAIEYSESLFDEIHSTLPIKVHRKAPDYFNKYGENMLMLPSRRISIQLGTFSSMNTRGPERQFILSVI